MEWIRVSILGNALGREVAQGLLSDLGYENLEIIEDQEAVEAVLLETSKYWDYASAQEIMGKEEPCVRVYLSKEEDGEEKLLAIRAAADRFREENPDLDLGAFSVSVQEMRDEDWANNWKQYYKPLEVGRRLAIVPEWEAYANQEGRTVVTMEPGAAFGTGQHETTLMCLELMEEMDLLDKRVLDVGCGTGILGITADKLGAREVLCVDMDPVAVSAARHNAALNGCKETGTRPVTSITVDSKPNWQGPPSRITGTLPSKSSRTCSSRVGLGRPDRLALGAAIGPDTAIRSSAPSWLGIRIPTVDSPAVTRSGTQEAAGTTRERGPGHRLANSKPNSENRPVSRAISISDT